MKTLNEESATLESPARLGPTVGDKIAEVSALPKKHLFASAARSGYAKNQALSELVDNSLDELRNTDGSYNPGSYVAIDIELGEGQTSYIKIDDNAGGVPISKFSRLISLGDGTKKYTNDLGVFGVGGKKGMLTLGEEVTICSRVMGDKGACVIIDDEWIEKDGWDIELREASDVPEGHTIYYIRRLRTRWEEEDVKSIKKDFGVRYGMLLKRHQDDLKILINGGEVEPQEDIKFIEGIMCPEPGFEPTEKTIKLGGGDRTVICTMKVGIMVESSQQEGYGADVYCNDRLVVRYDKIGFKEGKVGRPHPSLARLRSVIALEGAGINMPWNDSKNKLDKSNPLYMELEDIIEKEYLPYSKLLKDKKYKRLTNVLWKKANKLVESGEVNPEDIPKIRKSTVRGSESDHETQEGEEDEELPLKKRKKQTPNAKGQILVGTQIKVKMLKRVARKLEMEGRSNASIVRGCVKYVDRNIKL